MAESFSSPGGVSGATSQPESIPGINHASIGTKYDGYTGGISAPVNNPDVTTAVRCEVRSIVPDSEVDAMGGVDYESSD